MQLDIPSRQQVYAVDGGARDVTVVESDRAESDVRVYAREDGRAVAETTLGRRASVRALGGGDLCVLQKTISLQVLNAKLEEIWRVELSADRAQRTVTAETIFARQDLILFNDGSLLDRTQGGVVAYGREDGTVRWRREFPSEVSFLLCGDEVICAGAGRVWCLDVTSGEARVDGVSVVPEGDARDTAWWDGHRLWYASCQQNVLYAGVAGDSEPTRLELPDGFRLMEARHPFLQDGWGYLSVGPSDDLLKGCRYGMLCMEVGETIPTKIDVAPRAPHEVTVITDQGGSESYRVAVGGGDFDTLLMTARIVAKETAKTRGTFIFEDERKNPAFNGLVQIAVDLESLADPQREELEAAADQSAQELDSSSVKAGDGKGPIRMEVVQLEPGELDG
jgi:hypothetical protein